MRACFAVLTTVSSSLLLAGCTALDKSPAKQQTSMHNHNHDHQHEHDHAGPPTMARRLQMEGPPEPFVAPLPAGGAYLPLIAPTRSVSMRSGVVTLEPGAAIGWHSTGPNEELIICLVGAGVLAVEGQPDRPLAAGQFAYNPPQTPHNVINRGDEPLQYIFIVAPAVADDAK
jgi:quercetin dioxygenase-like cupin family protein